MFLQCSKLSCRDWYGTIPARGLMPSNFCNVKWIFIICHHPETMMQGDTGPWVSPDSLHLALVLRTSLHPSLSDLSSLDTRVAVISLSNASLVTSIPRPEASHCRDCGLAVSLAWAGPQALVTGWSRPHQTSIFYTWCPVQGPGLTKCNLVSGWYTTTGEDVSKLKVHLPK